MTDQLTIQSEDVLLSEHPAGKFRILAITSGKGNGFNFSPEVLQASLPLWNDAHVFINHDPLKPMRDVRDLAGLCSSPVWDPATQGITLEVMPSGPSSALLIALGDELLNSEGPHPKVGFSADLFIKHTNKEVTAIVKVNSVDLVYNPARGGAFIRALNSIQEKENPMLDPTPTNPPVGAGLVPAQASTPIEAAILLQQVRDMQLDTHLKASGLPDAATKPIRTLFTGRPWELKEVTTMIEDTRTMLSDLTGPSAVKGNRIQMTDTGDNLQCAVDDLLGAPRDEDKKDVNPARLTGIRELYLMLTGDDNLHGGYYPEHVRLSTTADFTGLVKNAMNKILVDRWTQLGRAGYNWWEKIVTIEHFNSLNTITGTITGTVGTLPTVAEGAEYTELAVGDSPETASFVKYGGYIPLTLELIDRDDARKLAAYPRELANAGLRRLSSLVAAIFTDNSNVGVALADGGALFNATAVTTAGGHANLLTVALAEAQLEVVKAAVYNQPLLVKQATSYYGTGPKMAVDPRYLLVPRALQLTAMKLIYPTLQNASQIYSENQQRGAPGDVVTVPEWTDATDWAMVCDPNVLPAIMVGERFGIVPQVFIANDNTSPAVFMNDEHRLKVRHFLAVWVNDFRPLHKENVAG